MDDKELDKILSRIIGADQNSEIASQMKACTDSLFCFYTSAINSEFTKNQAILLTNSMLTASISKGEGK